MSQPKPVAQTTGEDHCFIAGRRFSKKTVHSDFISICVPNMKLRSQKFIEEFFDKYSDEEDLDNFNLDGDYTSPAALDKIRSRFDRDLVQFAWMVMRSLMRTDHLTHFGILTDERAGWPLGTDEPVSLGPELTLPVFLDKFGLSIQEGELRLLEDGDGEQDACIRIGWEVTFDMPVEISHKLKPLFTEYLEQRFSNYAETRGLSVPYRKLVELTGWSDPGYQLFEECKHLKRRRDTVVVVNDRVLGVYTCVDCGADFTSPIQTLT